MRCGLLGRKLGHSYSPQIHAMLGDYGYELFEQEPEQLGEFLRHADFHGLNVTIPYKKAVIPYCASLSESASRLGAVNTLVRQADGSLLGHNSDYFGFRSMAEHSGLSFSGKKALVLGSGGASVTVQAVLTELGAVPVVISRTGENHYGNLHLHSDASLIVNTTPVGMYPNVKETPLTLDQFPHLEGVLDIIYNPARTQLLLDAEQRGLITQNGLWMLVAQAKESAECFVGHKLSDEKIPLIYNTLRRQMQNISLIGMPGCGKSTIGLLLAEKIKKTFVDADSIIAQNAGKDIPSIFREDGEEVFRAIESNVLAELGKHSGLVIATGGGCVTKPENYCHLHRNSTIIWLQRATGQLATDGRPLSQNGQLEQMYQTRRPLYESFCDHIIENLNSPQETVDAIVALEVTL